ncbi:hypothetical protein PoB_002418200 [Plakobranchus ocellatus]|uniref:Uncharacterized protein n=1 Tax=Plakobranchus ocellatus TaxID=259542 RepID=A0AAV3ZSR4_9GAST|nr:hypothetical protein PoB_002418200 [Plakobranchus ocellatus]
MAEHHSPELLGRFAGAAIVYDWLTGDTRMPLGGAAISVPAGPDLTFGTLESKHAVCSFNMDADKKVEHKYWVNIRSEVPSWDLGEI